MYPFLTASFLYNHEGMSVDYDAENLEDFDRDVNGTKIHIGGGVVFMPASQQHLGITMEAGVNLNSMKPDVDNADSISGTEIVVNVGLVGFLK